MSETMKDVNSGNIRIFEDMIEGAGSILIVTHMKPDGDAMGSALAMHHFLRNLGKSSRIILNDPYPPYLSFLAEKAASDSIITYDGEPAETEAAFAASDLIICLDFNAFHRTDRLEHLLSEAPGAKVLIDHHLNPARESFAISFSETEVSSASELLYQILKRTVYVNDDIRRLGAECAEALMTGMTTDTNNFANSVFPSTLHMASDLLEAGTDRDAILNRLYNQYSENRLRLMGHMMKDLLKITEDGVAYIVLDRKTQEKYSVEDGDTEGFVNMPLSIAEVKMSILAKEDHDRIRISIRSKRGTSANRCAGRFFNGGGHENAAGGRLHVPADVKDICDVESYIENVTHIFLNDEDHC